VTSPFSLAGRTALVTGAGRNVGQGVARVIAGAGAVVAVNDLHPERAEETTAEIASAGGRALSVPFDVTDRPAVDAAMALVEQELGPLDILVNNAGAPEGTRPGPFKESDPATWTPWIDLNLYGSMYLIRVLLPGMCARGHGRIIQISSDSASRGLALGRSVYAASKAGIEGLLRHVAMEVAPDGVTVNALSLGLMSNAVQHPQLQAMATQLPMGRPGEGDDVGAAVVWLASTAGAYVTGQVVHVNGGNYHGR
jgi:NAD(P)-dependent dehydrogenase (short-subunit alcohol dehydrogenase family)